jgi:hypothetical protein
MKSSPSTSLYTLGRGILSIGEWSGTTPPASYTDVGNCSKFEVEVTETKLDHYSSRSGTKTKDKSVVLETGYTCTFDLDEMSLFNLRIFLKATLVGKNVLRANTAMDKEYALKFVSDNPAGPDETWEFWRCLLSPGGPFSLISDEWELLTFSAEGLSDVANHSTSPYFNVTFSTTTTTTTTT